MSEIPIIGAGFNAGAFIAKAIDEGLSQNKAMVAFRAEGMKMGNESFRSMYVEVANAIADRDVIARLDYDALPPGDAYSVWSAGAEGDYATFVTSLTRMPGSVEMEPKYFMHVTADPHTPQEAIDAAAAHYTDDATSTGGTPKGSYMGSVVTSMTRTKGAP